MFMTNMMVENQWSTGRILG